MYRGLGFPGRRPSRAGARIVPRRRCRGRKSYEAPRSDRAIAHVSAAGRPGACCSSRVVLAWRFGHYSAWRRVNEPPASGAVLAGDDRRRGSMICLCHPGSGRAGSCRATGDFLGFLPDGDAWRHRVRDWAFRRRRGVKAHAGNSSSRPSSATAASDPWLAAGLALAARHAAVLRLSFGVGPLWRRPTRLLLGGLRLFLILLTLAVLLPQLQLRFDRQGWPDVVLLVDDSRSMGEPDHFARIDRARRRARTRRADSEAAQGQAPAERSRHSKLERRAPRPRTSEGRCGLTAEMRSAQHRLRPGRTSSTRQSRLAADAACSSPRRIVRPARQRLADVLLHTPAHEGARLSSRCRRAGPIKLSDAEGKAGEITARRTTWPAGHGPRKRCAAARSRRARTAGSAPRCGRSSITIAAPRSPRSSCSPTASPRATRRSARLGDYAAQKGVPLFFVGVGDDHEIRDLEAARSAGRGHRLRQRPHRLRGPPHRRRATRTSPSPSSSR